MLTGEPRPVVGRALSSGLTTFNIRTILLFEDRAVVEGLQKNIPAYADKVRTSHSSSICEAQHTHTSSFLQFPQWADHAHGILAFVLWSELG